MNMGAQELVPVKQVKKPTAALRLKRVASDLNRRLVSRMPPELMVEDLPDECGHSGGLGDPEKARA